MEWDGCVINAEIRNRVVDIVSWDVISQHVQLSRARLSGHVLCSQNIRPPYRVLFSFLPSERKKTC